MEIDNESRIERGGASVLDRARILSQALADAARMARVSKRNRRRLTSGGFQARRGAKAWHIVFVLSFIVMVAIPSLVGTAYYGFIAADQYVSEARFTVFGGATPSPDALGAISGIPAMAIIQDTQIVANFIHSRAAVEQLNASVGLRDRYSAGSADYFSRFNPKKPIEKFVRYWEGMSKVSIEMPAGIVDLKVWAFTPRNALMITSAVIKISEDLINNMNDRMNRDAVNDAVAEFARTSARLTKAQIALETARNDTGLIDAVKGSDAINKLITDTRSILLELQQNYQSEKKYVSESAPQMRALKTRIDTTASQITALDSKLTTTSSTSTDEPTLATSMTKFDELDLEHQVAERLYEGAAASLETAHLIAEHKMMYLNTFVEPVLPQEPEFPRRALMCLAIVAGSLAIWGLFCAMASLIRNYRA